MELLFLTLLQVAKDRRTEERLTGRYAAEDIINPQTGEVIANIISYLILI